jgi:hypothetical protein
VDDSVAVLVCCTAKARSAQLSAWCLMPLGGPVCDGMRVPPAMEPIALYCTAADEQTAGRRQQYKRPAEGKPKDDDARADEWRIHKPYLQITPGLPLHRTSDDTQATTALLPAGHGPDCTLRSSVGELVLGGA